MGRCVEHTVVELCMLGHCAFCICMYYQCKKLAHEQAVKGYMGAQSLKTRVHVGLLEWLSLQWDPSTITNLNYSQDVDS